MNVLVVSINYAPEPTGFAPHTAALCEYLASRGHSVMVITGFPFAPNWSRWAEYRGKFIGRERLKNVEVVRLAHFVPRRPAKLLQRLLMEGSFCLLAASVSLSQVRSPLDVILYVGAQPSLAMLTRLIAGLRGVPYVVAINDLAAQAAADVGIVKAEWLRRALAAFEYAAYRHASGAIVLCSSFREALIAHRYPADRIRFIRSPVDLELIRPMPFGSSFRQAQCLSVGDFVVLYSGSMGLKQGLVNVVEAALLLKDSCPTVKWVLVGDGELKPALQKLVARYDLAERVRLLPLQPEDQMSAMFSSADVLLLNQLSTVKDAVIPSKLLTYMAAGRAVLAAVNPSSQAAAIMREAQGELLVKPEDPAALAEAVTKLQGDPAALEAMGRRNRQYAEKHFDQRQIVAAQEAFLVEIADKARQALARA